MTTTFIKFSLQDKNGQAILGIDDGALQQSLILEITNPSPDKNITIKPLEEDKGYHFRLIFRPGTLLASSLDKINLSEKNIQEKWEIARDKDSFSFTYKGYKDEKNIITKDIILPDIILQANSKNSLILTLENISAEPGGGARGTRVELDYQNLFYADDKNSSTGTLLQYLNVVNHRGNQQIPLYIGFTGSDKIEKEQEINVGNKTPEEGTTKSQSIKISNLRVVGSNKILNDGTPNELILTFRHLQKNPFQKKENKVGLPLRGKDKYSDAATNFKISFDVLPKETSQNIKKIGLDIQQLTKSIVEQADKLLKSSDDSTQLKKLIELIVKKMEEAQTTRWQDIQKAEFDIEPVQAAEINRQNQKIIEPVQTAEINRQNQKIIAQGTQQISKAILNIEELPRPVKRLADSIQEIADASLELDKLCKKLIDSSQEKQLTLTDIKATAEFIQYRVKIILYWAQKLPEDTREALLCATDASKVQIELNKAYPATDWEIVPNFQGVSPQWTVTRLTTVPQLPGEILRLDINNIITILPAGYGNLYVYYENIPGYWDGYIICPIEKGPLMFRKDGQGQESLGIGTDTPEAKLHVVQKGLTNVAVFEGESGVAIKGAKGMHNALWITDAKTDYPALYVEQKGTGEAAYFGGKVQIQGSLSVIPLTQQNLLNYIDGLRKNNVEVNLSKISEDLGVNVSVYNGSKFVNDPTIKLHFSGKYIRVISSGIPVKLRNLLKEQKLDYKANFDICESQCTRIIEVSEKLSSILEIVFSVNNIKLTDDRRELLSSIMKDDRIVQFIISHDHFVLNIPSIVDSILYVLSTGQFGYYHNNPVELLEKGNHLTKTLISDIFESPMMSSIIKEKEYDISIKKELIEFFSQKLLIQEIHIKIDKRQLSDKEKILLIKKHNQFYIQIFDKEIEQSPSLKDQIYVVKWEEFVNNPNILLATEASSIDKNAALNLYLGDSTGLKYDQTTKKLGIWVDSKEQLQVFPDGVNIPNGKVRVDTINPETKLHIEGDVKVNGSISCGGKIAIKSKTEHYLGDGQQNGRTDNLAAFSNKAVGECEKFTLEMACSRDIKENIVSLTAEEALSTITQLNAVKYDYKGERTFRPNLGFIAEEMPDNLASADRKTLSPFEVIPVLTKVVQEQHQKIELLQIEVSELQKRLNKSEDLS